MTPTSQATYTAERFLRLADAVLRSKIVPLIDGARNAYYSYDIDFDLSLGSSFRIPSRAIGAKLENCTFLTGTQRQPATLYQEDELLDTSICPSSTPGFFIKRNKIVVLPEDGGGWDTFRMSIIMRPNKIVDPDDCAQITAIDTGTKVVTCTTVPAAWTTDDEYDMVQGEAHYDWLAIDQGTAAITTGAAGTLTFSDAIPDDLEVGDWIALAGEAPVVQCPADLHPLFAQECAHLCLSAQTDTEAYKLSEKELEMLRKDALMLINPRIERAGKILTNRTGILRRSS